MGDDKWRALQVLVAVLTVVLVVLFVWSLVKNNANLLGGGSPSSDDTQVEALLNDPLVRQVNEAFAEELTQAAAASSRDSMKPTPASVEIRIGTTRPTQEVIAQTTALPAFSEWSELGSCSSMVEWCATRAGDGGVTLLATWTRQGDDMLFRMSEN